MNRIWTLLPLCATLTACGPSRDKYFDQVIEEVCSYYNECYPDYMAYFGGDLDGCIESMSQYTDEMDEEYADCDYDRGAAKACLGDFKDLTCDDDYYSDDMQQDCEAVWDCGD